MARTQGSNNLASVGDLPLRASGTHEPLRGAAAKRERQILEAAMELFHERGYASTSVEDVASAVGILKGSLYHYIDSKEDLLYRIVQQVHEDVQQIMDVVSLRTDLNPLERIELYVQEQVLYNARNLRRISVYYQDRGRLSPERHTEIRRWRRQHERYVSGLLEEAEGSGLVPAGTDSQLAANCIFAIVIWMYTWYRPGGKTSARALADFCARFVHDGLTGGVLEPPAAAAAAI
jgi:AcrR family transcriptional regulator